MARLTSEELRALREKQDWKALWAAAISWVHFAASSIRTDEREDMAQSALLAVQSAIPSWDPDKAKFSTYIYRIARHRMLNYVRDAALARSKCYQLPEEDSPHEDGTGSSVHLTYSDVGYTPRGFGTADEELFRQHAAESLERLLAELPDETSFLLREMIGLPLIDSHEDPKNVMQVSRENALPHPTLVHRITRAKKTMNENQSQVYMSDTATLYPPEGSQSWRTHIPASRFPGFWNGVAGAMGDVDAWRENAGTVWGDWSWKPTDLDISRGARR